jgi:hypothetical protein
MPECIEKVIPATVFFTDSQLLQSGIRVSPVPLVTGKSGNAQL